MLRVNPQDLRAKKHAAVAGCLAFELQSQREILIRLFCGQVSVLVGRALAEDRSLLYDPLFVAILLPASKVFPVKERNPAPFLRSLSQGAQPEEQRYCEYPTTSFHDKPSACAHLEIVTRTGENIIMLRAEEAR